MPDFGHIFGQSLLLKSITTCLLKICKKRSTQDHRFLIYNAQWRLITQNLKYMRNHLHKILKLEYIEDFKIKSFYKICIHNVKLATMILV